MLLDLLLDERRAVIKFQNNWQILSYRINIVFLWTFGLICLMKKLHLLDLFLLKRWLASFLLKQREIRFQTLNINRFICCLKFKKRDCLKHFIVLFYFYKDIAVKVVLDLAHFFLKCQIHIFVVQEPQLLHQNFHLGFLLLVQVLLFYILMIRHHGLVAKIKATNVGSALNIN